MYMFFWFFKQLYYILRRIFKKSLLLLFIFFIIFILFFVKKTFAFTSEEQQIIDNYKSTMINNSSLYPVDGWTLATPNKRIFMSATGTYNNTNFYYIACGSWNTQISYYIVNNQFRAYNSTYASHDLLIFYYDGSLNCIGSQRVSVNSSGSWYYLTGAYIINYFSSDLTVKDNYNGNTISPQMPVQVFTDPSITTESSSIINWTFTNLIINCGSVLTNSLIELDFNYNNTYYSLNIDNYISISNNTVILTIPRTILSNYFVVRSGNTITFKLYVRNSSTGPSTVRYYDLGSYTLDLTTQQEQEINEDSNKDLLHDINNSQQETNNYLQNDNVDNSSITLPSDNSNDITKNGVNSIFNMIYNAFCTGEAQDIVFPIPFTNKNITLQANYIQNMLSNNNATWVITIIQAFWWYLISHFIVKDIVKITVLFEIDI